MRCCSVPHGVGIAPTYAPLGGGFPTDYTEQEAGRTRGESHGNTDAAYDIRFCQTGGSMQLVEQGMAARAWVVALLY